MMVDAVAVLVQALSLVALFQAAGGAVFLTLFGLQLRVSVLPIVRGVRLAAVVAVALVLLHFSLTGAQLTGDFPGLYDSRIQHLAWQSATGTALRLRLLGLALVLVGLAFARAPGQGAARRRVRGLLCMTGSLLVVVAFTRLGHTVDHAPRTALTALLVVHLMSVTCWFGAIWPLRQAATLESPATAGAVLESFSRIAVWTVPVLLLAGGALVALLIPGWSAFAQPYGQLLLAKLAGFSVLLGLAALNKLRLVPALRQNLPSAVSRLRLTLGIEFALIAAVLAVTAVMTGLYSPD